MQITSLTKPAQAVLDSYLNLSTKGHNIPCPYYNNKHTKLRGALRVNIGKGSPSEIVQEAHLMALKDKVDLSSLNADDTKKFLVEHNLGVDCSAFVYYVLGAEFFERTHKSLARKLKFQKTYNIVRNILRKLRTAENTNVLVLADDKNSRIIKMNETRAGDMIIIMNAGPNNSRNHILLAHEVSKDKIKYTHSLQWSKDGQYDHGVRQGIILITDPLKPLIEQTWVEKNKTGDENETFLRAKQAHILEIRRLHCL